VKNSLGADLSDKKDLSKRKMTQAIIEEHGEKTKEAYEFLEEDDDFEEFEVNNEETMNVDMDMDKQLWGQDWDDHEAETDFQSRLRSQFKLAQK